MYLYDCRKVAAVEATVKRCQLHIGMVETKDENMFHYNTLKEAKFVPGTDDQHSTCPPETAWNTNQIKESVLKWSEKLESIDDDVVWMHSTENEPFEEQEPRLNIVLNHFVARKAFDKQKVVIRSASKALWSGSLSQGRITASLNSTLARRSEWRAPLVIDLQGMAVNNVRGLFVGFGRW